MLLGDLMNCVAPLSVEGALDREITGIAYDSKKVESGSLFVALPGAVTDGRRFIADAARQGAAAVMGRGLSGFGAEGLTRVEVEDPRRAMGRAAACLAGNPSASMDLVGITGTNGKTTTAYLLRAAWEHAGRPAGLIGTIEYSTGTMSCSASRTTPESPDIQGLLQAMLAGGRTCAVMEVSSHGLAQGRVEGCQFEAGIFTLVTRDHLDYHGTREVYLRAKADLVDYVRPGGSLVLNRHDDAACSLVVPRAQRRKVIFYGTRADADLQAANVRCSLDGITMDLLWRGSSLPLRSPLLGWFNVENILAALGGALATGVDPALAAAGVETVPGVPGRFERVDGGAPYAVIVDYAHTDDALEKLLKAVRSLTPGKVICVFGCGGDRDRTKRGPMGRASEQWSDRVIVTTDNPRREDPRVIFNDILAGMTPGAAEVIEDRREAILRAVDLARAGDAVVIAGKGHESVQEIDGVAYPFSDREAAGKAIAAREGRTGGRR